MNKYEELLARVEGLLLQQGWAESGRGLAEVVRLMDAEQMQHILVAALQASPSQGQLAAMLRDFIELALRNDGMAMIPCPVCEGDTDECDRCEGMGIVQADLS